MKKINKTLSLINMRIKNKQYCFFLKKNLVNEEILHFFISENIIQSFFCKDGYIYIKLTKNSIINKREIINMWSSKKKIVSYQDLKKNNKFKNKNYILSTNNGLIQSSVAKKKKIGGFLLLSI